VAAAGWPNPPRPAIDEAIRVIIKNVFGRAFGILERNRPVLERCARELLAKETLDEAAIQALTRETQPALQLEYVPTRDKVAKSELPSDTRQQ
jgi:ATP-dependent Zn protease